MALTRLTDWNDGDVLTSAALEAEFDNIYNNSLSLVSPLTGNLAFGAFRATGLSLGSVSDPSLQFTGDTNTGVYSSAADTVNVATGGVLAGQFGATAIINAAPEDSRTNTVDVALTIRSTTSGTPASGIGVGINFEAESADENPSIFGQINFAATDIGAGTEDTLCALHLRVAGSAIAPKYQFASTATGDNLVLFNHAVTANRTITIPDATTTMLGTDASQTISNKIGVPVLIERKLITANATTVTFNTGVAGNTDEWYILKGHVLNNSGAGALYTWRPNNLTTDQTSTRSQFNAASTGLGSNTLLELAGAGSIADTATWIQFEAKIYAKNNPNSIATTRHYICTARFVDAGANLGVITIGQWNETATEITSIVVVCDQTNGIGDGSVLELWKMQGA